MLHYRLHTFVTALLLFPFVTQGCDGNESSTMDGMGGVAGVGGVAGAATAVGGSNSGAGTAGVAGATPELTLTGEDLLIDDFEDGDGTPLVGDGGWYSYTDTSTSQLSGNSTITFATATGTDVVMAGEGYKSQKSLSVSCTFDQGTLTYAPYVGVGVSLGTESAPYDLSAYAGLYYTYKGAAHRLRIHPTEVTDYDDFGVKVPASTSWTTIVVPFKNFTQEGWGEKVSLDLSHTVNVGFHIAGATGAAADLMIDNLAAVKRTPTEEPDMTIRPAATPADNPIDSVAITNPLQAKAMRYLTKGYNVTNWLEQDRFTGFTYDETYVANLAAAGFLGLRLPIDFDLYVDSVSGTGDTLAVTVSPDLFTILDSFDTWTKTHGLSLTIDYHQYDKSLNMVDDSQREAVLLWGEVAKHFAGNAREDLFFEILNEPALSFADDSQPTQDDWTVLANQMIGAIRAAGSQHTIIFGDTQWYNIPQLTKRTPLSDTNVVYAFHNYDPFIFTHQGASWANMASTHDIPYPYDPARWSEYYSDLGFTPLMESWILSSADGYYATGNRSAIRNTILEAKKWAVTNNVPVICNEFGALELTARLEDTTRYYTDLVSIFEELEIPWAIWFMIMDEAGVVIPEYRAAMHLGE